MPISNPATRTNRSRSGRTSRSAFETGVAGLSIEDATGDIARPLYELPLAVERIRAARAAVDASGTGVLLTARAECYLVGHPDPLRESIRRLERYADAGADVLYAPGREEVARRFRRLSRRSVQSRSTS